MDERPWQSPEFWTVKTSLLRRAAQRYRARDHSEAIGSVWSSLERRFPNGLPTNSEFESSKLLDRLVFRYAKRHHKRETLKAKAQRELSSRSYLALRYPVEVADSTRQSEIRDLVESLLANLARSDRQLLEESLGLGDRERSVAEIAQSRHVSRQAIHKKRQKLLIYLKSSASA